MNAKKCDRCGRYYDKVNSKPPYTLFKTRTFIENTERIDLCDDCSNDLAEWYNIFRKLDESEVEQ